MIIGVLCKIILVVFLIFRFKITLSSHICSSPGRMDHQTSARQKINRMYLNMYSRMILQFLAGFV